MREIILFGICLAIAYWFDQHYYHGLFSASLAEEMHHIAVAFK